MCDECDVVQMLSPQRFSRRDALKFAAVAAAASAAAVAGDASAAPLSTRSAPAARRALVGGSVITMVGSEVAQAVLIENDRIVEVGDDAQILRSLHRRGGGAVTRLSGQTVVPGFIDPHGHFLLSGMYGALTVDLASPPLGRVQSLKQALDVLRAEVRRSPKPIPGFLWTIGTLYDDTAVREKRFPTLAELDGVSARDPIMVVHNSAHVATVNSAGLRALGISRSTRDTSHGAYGRRPDGSLNGMLYESAVEKALTSALPTLAGTGLFNVVDVAMQRTLSNGVSTALDASVNPTIKIAYNALAATPFLKCRLGLWMSTPSIDKLDASLANVPQEAPWVQTVGVKGFADGSIQGWTAALREPYFTFPDGGAPQGPRGKLRTTVPELTRLIVTAAAHGLPAAIHANGDAAVDAVIAATRNARRTTARPVRVLMQHCQVVHDDQIDDMRDLGITASVFSRHISVWGDRHRDLFLGPERASRMGPSRSFIDNGISLTLHTDSPVTPLQPLIAMRDAVERRTGSGAVLGADQRITPREALAAYTSEAAAQLGLRDRGRIARGLLADLTVLNRSPLDTPLSDVHVTQTWVGGVRAWHKR